MNQRRTRFLWTSLLAAMLVTLIVAPTAMAAKPTRTVLGPSEPSVTPAGEGCPFAILWEPSSDARRMIFEYDDGRMVFITNGNPTLTNLDNGKTFSHRARYHIVETFDPAANEIIDVITGQIIVEFWQGDQGPSGVVTQPYGATLRFTGSMRIVADADTFVYTSFSYSGQFTDVCAALS